MIYAFKTFSLSFICIWCLLIFCRNNTGHTSADLPADELKVFAAENSVKDIALPTGFHRVKLDKDHFANWLRDIELKKDKTVYLFDGTPKQNQGAQYAVLNVTLTNENLQQCADAVMRLRAEYLFAKQAYAQIAFYDNNKKLYQFDAPFTRVHFEKYLRTVFSMCGTASLSKQLKNKATVDIEPGDVFIRGGFPGHAVIVMDVAVNKTGKRIFLLAQSYMPAQDVHLLKNPASEDASPWYEITGEDVTTPEYRFRTSELKSW